MNIAIPARQDRGWELGGGYGLTGWFKSGTVAGVHEGLFEVS